MIRVALIVTLAFTAGACNVRHSHVSSTNPENGSTVDEAPRSIEVKFDSAMESTTISTATFLVDGSTHGRFQGSVSYDALTQTASFTPTEPLQQGEVVTITLTNDIESTSDKPLRAFVAVFTVRPPKQPDPFDVVSIDPARETVGVADRPTIKVRFTTTYNPFTVTADTVLVSGSRSGTIEPVFPNVLMGIDELTIQLDRALIAGERLTVSLGGGLASVEGAVLETTRIEYTVATEAALASPTGIASGALPSSDARVIFLDVDRDGRDEWVVIHRDGRIEAQELIVDTVSALEIQQLSEGVIDTVVGDFDGDGRSDLVCLGESGTKIHVLLGSNLSSRILDVAFTADLEFSASGLASAPIDFDAFCDLLVVPADPAQSTIVAFGATPTPFLETVASTVSITAPAVLADFDGDGFVDVAHGLPGGGIAWSRGTVDGRFEEAGEISTITADALVVANLNDDPHPDLVVLGPATVRGAQLLSDGTGNFDEQALPLEAAAFGSAIVDFDNDGTIDAISPRSGSVDAVLWGGLSSESDALTMIEEPRNIAFGDIDGDNVIDLGTVSITGRWDVLFNDPVTPPLVDRVFATNVTAAAGATNQPFEIRADHADALDGFTVAFSYDPSLVTLERLTTVGSDSEVVGVELELPNFDSTNGTAVIAVIFDFMPPFDTQQLLPGTDHRLLTGDISLASGVAAQTTSLICGTGIGSPPNDTSFVVAGFTVDPILENGTVTIEAGGPPPPAQTFIRADLNDDGLIDIADPNFLSAYLFQGGPAPACLQAGDVNDDGTIDAADTTYLFDYLLSSGAAPPAPFPAAGVDPTDDALGCDSGS